MAEIVKVLLFEARRFAPEIITEHIGDRKVTKMRGIYSVADMVNANNRIYRKPLLEREVQRLQSWVTERRLLSELDHTQTPEVMFKNVCAMTTNLDMDGNNVYGISQILETPNGRILDTLVKENVFIGISSRATGSVVESMEIPGVMEVSDDLEVSCWDFVSQPSFTMAKMEVTLEEARRRYYESAKKHGFGDSETRKLLVKAVDEIIKSSINYQNRPNIVYCSAIVKNCRL